MKRDIWVVSTLKQLFIRDSSIKILSYLFVLTLTFDRAVLCQNVAFSIAVLAKKGFEFLNPLSANFAKWSNTLKQFVGKLSTNCLSVFDNTVGLEFKG